ncbi:hypothetical protein MTO96_027147 [Rhipicephalus appendiculatus]
MCARRTECNLRNTISTRRRAYIRGSTAASRMRDAAVALWSRIMQTHASVHTHGGHIFTAEVSDEKMQRVHHSREVTEQRGTKKKKKKKNTTATIVEGRQIQVHALRDVKKPGKCETRCKQYLGTYAWSRICVVTPSS